MKQLQVVDFKKHYIDDLEVWVEVPVWDQADLIKLVNDIDWGVLPIDEYKKLLVDNWPGLPKIIKAKLDNQTVRNELYDVLLHENWGLSPSEKRGPEEVVFYSEVEQDNVQEWFKSHGSKGQKPAVI